MENIVLDKSFQFALDSVNLYRVLNEQKQFVFAQQYIKCSTSVGANVNEAQAAQTKKDFIAKMAIASKESRECLYWLELLESSRLVDYDYQRLKEKAEEITRLLTSIVKTAQTN